MAMATVSADAGGTTTAPTVIPNELLNIASGTKGTNVKTLQQQLISAGYKISADGIYGAQTANAVNQYKIAQGITPVTYANKATRSAYLTSQETAPAPAPVPIAQTAQAQQDYYAVVNPAQQAQAQPDYYAVAQPPSAQQLGATAQDYLAMGNPELNPIYQTSPNTPNSNVPAPTVAQPPVTMGGLRQAEQTQAVSQATMADMKLAEEAQTEQTVKSQLDTDLGVAGVAPTGTTVTPSGTTTETATVTGITPIDTTVPPPPKFVSGGGGMASVSAPSGTLTGAGGGTTGGGAVAMPSSDALEAAGTMPGLQGMASELFERMNTMTSEWSPETDPDYNRDALQMENKVAQMMVARGGLYSSVARAALQSSLIDLQSNYRKQAYDRFISERKFVFDQLQFVSQRIDAEFQKAIATKNYELSVQKEAFDQKMAIAQFNADQAYKKAQLSISRANAENAKRQAAYQQQLAEAAQNQQKQYNYYNNLSTTATGETAQYNKYFTDWQNKGYLSTDAMAYLGVKSDSAYSWSSAVQGFANKQYYIDGLNSQATTGLRSLGDAEVTLGTYDQFLKDNTTPINTGYDYQKMVQTDEGQQLVVW